MSEQHREAALKRGAERTAKTVKRLEDTLDSIANEMRANGGIYPHNGGAVSVAEIARRAGINEATLYKKDNAHLKERAVLWLDNLKRKEIVGRTQVRKSFQQRAEGWKEKYDALQDRHIITELQLQQLQAKYEKLNRDYAVLLEQMKSGVSAKLITIHKETLPK